MSWPKSQTRLLLALHSDAGTGILLKALYGRMAHPCSRALTRPSTASYTPAMGPPLGASKPYTSLKKRRDSRCLRPQPMCVRALRKPSKVRQLTYNVRTGCTNLSGLTQDFQGLSGSPSLSSMKVRSLIDAGVGTFVCLQESVELRRFTPYMSPGPV